MKKSNPIMLQLVIIALVLAVVLAYYCRNDLLQWLFDFLSYEYLAVVYCAIIAVVPLAYHFTRQEQEQNHVVKSKELDGLMEYISFCCTYCGMIRAIQFFLRGIVAKGMNKPECECDTIFQLDLISSFFCVAALGLFTYRGLMPVFKAILFKTQHITSESSEDK